ncbi:MAG: pre-peptidase C-terminal domain-containing protein [Bryobacterales bacterium]|nr:pre-peptidase C-terminal domain-containing protein [Bryobacterales bacterium]
MRWLLVFLTLAAQAQTVAPQGPARSPALAPSAPDELPLAVAAQLPLPPAYSLGVAASPVPRAANQVGFHRAVPAAALQNGRWVTTPSGARVWLLVLQSRGASDVRLHFDGFSIAGGKVFLFAAGERGATSVHGPYAGRGHKGDGEFWAGSVEGDTVVLEYQPAGTEERVPFSIDRLSHGFGGLKSGQASITLQDLPVKAGEERAVASCHVDAMCNTSYRDSMEAVARIRLEDEGGTYVCTGWLINTRSSSLVPYLITNNHCIPNQTVANTLETFFRYRTSSCNGLAPALPPRSTLGSTYLAGRTPSVLDFAFVRLPAAPAGSLFLGWDTTKASVNTSITAMGHPDGSYLRSTTARITADNGAKFSFTPTAGLTEGGSSGSPWMSSPSVVRGLHARGNSSNFADPCRALSNNQISGGGEWFAEIYPLISSYLEDGSANCTFSLSSSAESFPSTGGATVVSVTASANTCAWTASTSASFVSITGGISGTGNGTVTFTVSANTAPTARSGTLTIAGRTFTVSQAGAPVSSCVAESIAPGSPLTGILRNTSCASQLRPGAYANRYRFEGTAGQTITIDMTSGVFDTYLYLVGPNGAVVAEDDDGGTDTNSRIPRDTGSFALTATGTYTIEATSFSRSGSATGSFALTLRVVNNCSITPISFDTPVTGALTTTDCFSPLGGDFYVKRYTVRTVVGQRLRVTMQSASLDTYLTLIGPDGSVVAEDDDSAGNLNSRIPASGFLTVTQSGTYTIEASTYNELAVGAFTLLLESDGTVISAGPKFRAVTPCRVVDSRDGGGKTGAFGPPIFTGGATRNIPIPQSSCGIPANAQAYSLNITVVPNGALSYLSVWPAGQPQPLVSTLNSFDGRVLANAAIVPAGTSGAISVFVTDNTHVIIDINGYFE